MFKVSFYLMLMTLILECDSVKKKENTNLNSTNMSTTEMFNTIGCQDKIRSFGLAENTLSDFFDEIIRNENSIKKVDLIFFIEKKARLLIFIRLELCSSRIHQKYFIV